MTVRRGERLSAIDLIKRFAHDAGQLPRPTERFPATSAIAVADYRLALVDHWDKTGSAVEYFVAALDSLIATFPAKEQGRLRFSKPKPIPILRTAAEHGEALARYDGDYYYPEFYAEARFLQQAGREPSAKLRADEHKALIAARDALRNLYRRTDELKIPRPAIYYAIIALDGDRMGARLSHEAMMEAGHRQISAAMATFAQEDVPRIAGNDFPALWVYAGGDDALVLSPAACSLEVAEAPRFRRACGTAAKGHRA